MVNTSEHKLTLWKIMFLLFLIIGSVWIICKQKDTPYQTNHGLIFGTVYNITYQYDKDLNDEILQVLNDVDASLSPFNDTSVITKINKDAHPLHVISARAPLREHFTEVFRLAERISKETDGGFDITVAPLVNYWGFGFQNADADTKDNRVAVDSIRQFVGYRKVHLSNNRITKDDARLMLDCSAIAKGYGADMVARHLYDKGIRNYMVEIGGEIVSHGISPRRIPWRIGVTKPVDDSLSVNDDVQTMLNVSDVCLATSGNYRKFYYRNGRKYAHTIDPATGFPVQHNILSATVIAPSCAEADAYATAFMVMGAEKAKAILSRHPQLMAYLICSDAKGRNTVWFSPKMKSLICK